MNSTVLAGKTTTAERFRRELMATVERAMRGTQVEEEAKWTPSSSVAA